MSVTVKLFKHSENKFLKVNPVLIVKHNTFVKLKEIGRLSERKLTGNYKTGQLFLHKLFGYRGLILFPWLANVYNRDKHKTDSNIELQELTERDSEPEANIETYYSALIDIRDCPYIRVQPEAVTFMDNGRSLYAIPGLDYVHHDDVLPYTATEIHPLKHELLDKFLFPRPGEDPPFAPLDTLRTWQKKNRAKLELCEVHKETTENVRVTVCPFYMGCRDCFMHWWRYCICLENLGDLAVQLRERHWRIFSLSGALESMKGRGVVGQEPILTRNQPAFQYSSHVSLQTPSGHMWGSFRMEREDGFIFDCKIPPFSLETKREDMPSPSNTSESE